MTTPSEHSFVKKFEEAWSTPDLDSLTELLAENVTLIQPLSKPIYGKPAAVKSFEKILRQYPGIRGEEVFGLGQHDRVIIDWKMVVPIGRQTLRIPVIDSFYMDHGLVSMRIAYFNPIPILKAIAVHPSHWWRLV